MSANIFTSPTTSNFVTGIFVGAFNYMKPDKSSYRFLILRAKSRTSQYFNIKISLGYHFVLYRFNGIFPLWRDVLHRPGIILSPIGRFSMQKVKNHLCKEAENSDKYLAIQCAIFLEVSTRTTLVLVLQIMKPPQGVILLAGSPSYRPLQRSYKRLNAKFIHCG